MARKFSLRFWDRRRLEEAPPKRELRFTEVAERSRRRRQLLRFAATLFAIFLFVGFVALIISRCVVKKVSCSLGGETCENELADRANALRGKSLFAKLTIDHPYLSVTIRRKWPDEIEVTFGKPQILTVIKVGDESFWALTDQGYLIKAESTEQTVQISDPRLAKLAQGEKVESGILDFYRALVVALAKAKGLPIREIRVMNEDEVWLMLEQNTLAIMTSRDLERQVSSLQAIYESPTIAREGKTIDLRFDNPVLK